MNYKKIHTCCFFGHRKISKTDELKTRLYSKIESLILKHGVDTFLFGSKSQFDEICHTIVTNLKEKYPHIKRIYVRAAFADIDDSYKGYLLERYEDTYYSENARGACRAVYIKRNQEMINRSKFCVFYYDQNYFLPAQKNGCKTKSGTAAAYDYAVKKKKEIINVFK